MKTFNRILVLLDTDKIHEFVFATNKLKEIRGASAILNELNLEKTNELIQNDLSAGSCEKIFIGGGSGKIVFDDINTANAFCQNLEKNYNFRTHGEASITTAMVAFDDSTPEKFKESLYRGEKELRKNKDFKYRRIQLLTDHYFETCASNAMFLAEHEAPEDTKIRISSACKNKRKAAIEGKYSFFAEFVKFINENKEPKLEEIFKKNNWHTKLSNFINLVPEDINSIGNLSGEYIGLVYADGNRMGQKLQEFENIEKYSSFSEDVIKHTKEAIFEALARHLKMENLFPFEILLLGGDDLLVIVPADKAVHIAIDFCNFFKTRLFSHKVSISAGVVIAHANYPIHQMIDYGEQLLKSAKKKGNENPSAEENYIDFMVIKGPICNKVNDIRENMLTYTSEDRTTIRLFQRPYTTAKLKQLTAKINKLKGEGKFPRSRLKQMYKFLFRGKNQAILDYFLLLSRLEEDTSQKVMKKEFLVSCDLFPWQRVNNDLETPFLDLIELYDYIKIAERKYDDRI